MTVWSLTVQNLYRITVKPCVSGHLFSAATYSDWLLNTGFIIHGGEGWPDTILVAKPQVFITTSFALGLMYNLDNIYIKVFCWGKTISNSPMASRRNHFFICWFSKRKKKLRNSNVHRSLYEIMSQDLYVM